MMDFLNHLIGGGDGCDADLLHQAFMEGDQEAKEWCRKIVDKAKKYIDGGNPMEGTVMLFTAVLRAAGMIKQGVYGSVRAHGDQSPVKQTWDILEKALTAEDMDRAVGELMKKMGREGL